MNFFLIVILFFGAVGLMNASAQADEETSAYIPIKMEAPTFTQDTPLTTDAVAQDEEALPFRDTFPPPKVTAQVEKKQDTNKLDVQQIMQQESKLLNALIGDSNTDTE